MTDIAYRFSSGWRRVHTPKTGHDVADDLTTAEFVIAMLAARDRTGRSDKSLDKQRQQKGGIKVGFR